MKSIWKTNTSVLAAICLLLLTCGPLFAETVKVRVSAYAPINRGDVATAQSEALDEALVKAVEKVVAEIVPDRTYVALEPLLELRIIPQAELFVSNYQIVKQDVSDLAYTVHLSVTVDRDLLRQNLARIGVIKEPGSPPLAAVFVTVDAPLGLDHVRTLGLLAQKTVGQAMEAADIVVIPAPRTEGSEEEEFRILRPPQAPEALVAEGLSALADLAVGVLFRKTGEARITGSTMTIPMSLAIQVVDVKTGALVDVALQEVDVSLGTTDGKFLSAETGKVMGEMASRLSRSLIQRYIVGETSRAAVVLILEGPHEAISVRYILQELQFRLGQKAYILPESFSRDLSRYLVWTEKSTRDVADILSSMKNKPQPFSVLLLEDGVKLTMGNRPALAGVLEYGEELTFYRRLPVPGVENPDDIRKIEFVPWQEYENNGEVASANAAPVGMGVLGRIDPPRDLDFFQFRLPDGAREVSISVEQAGPGEVRPKVRVFRGEKLVHEQAARGRGRNLFFSLRVEEGTRDLRISVEDYLGRYPSMFPYVLKINVTGNRESDEPT